MRIATIDFADYEAIEEREAYFAKRAKGKPAVEQNGQLEGGKYTISTKQDLVDFLNHLAHKIGIERTPLNPNGYLATVDNIG